MNQNIEIKARLSEKEFERIKSQAARLATEPPTVLVQTDTFFDVPRDRLKLREFEDGTAELIAYSRSDNTRPEFSNYILTPVSHPEKLKESLQRTIGVRGQVKKQRNLFIHEQTRIHLDTVKDLGHFLELEVVLNPDQTTEFGNSVANQLMSLLKIETKWLVSCAYIDLLPL